MSILTHYHIIPFDEESKSGFKVNNNSSNIQKFTEQDADKIFENYKNNANLVSTKRNAEIIEKAYNNAIEKAEKKYAQKYKDFINDIENINFKDLINDFGKDIINIKFGHVTANKEFIENHFDQVQEYCKKHFNKTEILSVNKMVSAINGLLNKVISGEIFEKMIALIMGSSAEILNALVSTKTEELIEDDFVNKLSNSFENAIKTNIDNNIIQENKIGNKPKDKEIIQFLLSKHDGGGFDTITIKNSYYKSDISVKIPNEQMINFSAKNYSSNSSYISLVAHANLVALIEQWECEGNLKNLAINGLSARSISTRQFNLMKKLFLLQASIGTSKKSDILADYWIFNTKEGKIRVLSLYDVFFGNNNFMKEINTKGTNKLNTPNYPRKVADFNKFVKETTISLKAGKTINSILKSYDDSL